MPEARRHLDRILRRVLTTMLLSAMAFAQGSQAGSGSSPQRDLFAALHASLRDSADKTLAAVLADRPWMKTETLSADGGSRLSSTKTDPVVRLRAALERFEHLRPMIEPILREQGVPAELSAVVLVESGGQITALSPKGARGIWQFMPDTARRYGLVVDARKDERLDVPKSTRAAARYLRDLRDQFATWPLALAAYNAGEDAVQHAIGRTGTINFAELRRSLPPETRDYVPAVIAAEQRFASQSPNLQSGSRQVESGRRVYASEVRD